MNTHELTMRIRRASVLLLCATLALPGCATTGSARAPAGTPVGQPSMDAAVLAEYVQRLPVGSQVKVERANGGAVRGTLMKATDEIIIVQPRRRVPEPPLEIALRDVLSVTPDAGAGSGSSVARAIGIGAAAGAGAALAVFFIIIAALSD